MVMRTVNFGGIAESHFIRPDLDNLKEVLGETLPGIRDSPQYGDQGRHGGRLLYPCFENSDKQGNHTNRWSKKS